MNPLVNVHYPTNTDADLDRLQKLAEQLSGFDERVSLEWLDGAMTALAAGPRPTTVMAWRDALLGDAWSRAFGDPESDREATTILETRWRVLVKQLDPELLMDAMDELRLAPVMLEWSDDDKAKLVEDGTIAAGEEDDEIPLTGEIWAHGFMDVVQTFTDDWPEPDVETEMGQAFDECTMRIVMLTIHDPEELAKVREELYPGEKLTRERPDPGGAVRRAGPALLLGAERPEARDAPRRGAARPQRSVPLRQREEVQEVPWHVSPHAPTGRCPLGGARIGSGAALAFALLGWACGRLAALPPDV